MHCFFPKNLDGFLKIRDVSGVGLEQFWVGRVSVGTRVCMHLGMARMGLKIKLGVFG